MTAGTTPINAFASAQQVFQIKQNGRVDQLTDFLNDDLLVDPSFAARVGELFFSAGRYNPDLWRYSSATDRTTLVTDGGPYSEVGEVREAGGRIYVSIRDNSFDGKVFELTRSNNLIDLGPDIYGDSIDLEVEGNRLFAGRYEFRANGTSIEYDNSVGSSFFTGDIALLGSTPYAISEFGRSDPFRGQVFRFEPSGTALDITSQVFGNEYIGVSLTLSNLAASGGELVSPPPGSMEQRLFPARCTCGVLPAD